MREALAEALSDFPGAIVLVSHDRHLIGLVSDTFWRVADGVVKPFAGDLDEYAAWLRTRANAGDAKSPPVMPQAAPAPRRPSSRRRSIRTSWRRSNRKSPNSRRRSRARPRTGRSRAVRGGRRARERVGTTATATARRTEAPSELLRSTNGMRPEPMWSGRVWSGQRFAADAARGTFPACLHSCVTRCAAILATLSACATTPSAPGNAPSAETDASQAASAFFAGLCFLCGKAYAGRVVIDTPTPARDRSQARRW